MNRLPGNPHSESFYKSVDEFGDLVIGEEGQTGATIIWSALVDLGEAILANAYETRTGTLLARYEATKTNISADHDLRERVDDRLGIVKPPPEPVRHYRTGPGKCNCGFNAYKLSGIMIDYHEELQAHLRRNR